MPVKQYQKSHVVQAIQFQNTEATHIQEIIDFVGLPISIDFTSSGVKLRVIRGALDVLVVPQGNYIVMHRDGTLEKISAVDFNYEEVVAP